MGFGFKADSDLTIGEKLGMAGCTYIMLGGFLSLLAIVLVGSTTLAVKVGVVRPYSLGFYLGYGASALLAIPLYFGLAMYMVGCALDGVSKGVVALMNRRRLR